MSGRKRAYYRRRTAHGGRDPTERIVKLYVSESFQAKCVKEKNDRFIQEAGSDVGYGICACVGHEDSAGNPCRRTPDGVYGGRYFRETPHVLVLENIQDPGNLGTIFRTAEAAGATGIVLSKDCVDLYNPKVIRSTMGAIFRIPFIYTDDLKGTIDELKREGITVYAAHLKGKTPMIWKITRRHAHFLSEMKETV